MVSVKDICDPVTGLIKRVKDRQIASELREIQALISSLQSEHFEARERNIKLLSENARLQWEITDLQARQSDEIARLKQEQADAITQLKKEHAAEIAPFKKASDYAFGESFSSEERSGNRIGTPDGY
jgi:hypothetical protein